MAPPDTTFAIIPHVEASIGLYRVGIITNMIPFWSLHKYTKLTPPPKPSVKSHYAREEGLRRGHADFAEAGRSARKGGGGGGGERAPAPGLLVCSIVLNSDRWAGARI